MKSSLSLTPYFALPDPLPPPTERISYNGVAEWHEEGEDEHGEQRAAHWSYEGVGRLQYPAEVTRQEGKTHR